MTPVELTTKRRDLGLTQAQLAKALGLDVRTIVRYENDWTPIPVAVAYMIERMGS